MVSDERHTVSTIRIKVYAKQEESRIPDAIVKVSDFLAMG